MGTTPTREKVRPSSWVKVDDSGRGWGDRLVWAASRPGLEQAAGRGGKEPNHLLAQLLAQLVIMGHFVGGVVLIFDTGSLDRYLSIPRQCKPHKGQDLFCICYFLRTQHNTSAGN